MPYGVQPFTTKNFAPKGGGIDFLGLRIVNLRILTQDLIPGINNATSDFGFFCLATWIPWKFRNLCPDAKDYTESNYFRFQETVEVAMSHSQRDNSPAHNRYGPPNRRIGVDQKLLLPAKLGFDAAKRTDATSVFAAPLYGPSLRSLGLHAGFAKAKGETLTRIHGTSDDADTTLIAEYVDASLRESKYYPKFNISPEPVTEAMIDDLGLNGFHPSFFRDSPRKIKQAFIRKLLPAAQEGASHPRTLTANLILQTIGQDSDLTTDDLRAVWHTGTTRKRGLVLKGPEIIRQRERWEIFTHRQYQRYCLEMFMHCFEQALIDGCHSIRQVVDKSVGVVTKAYPGQSATFEAIVHAEAKAAGLKPVKNTDALSTAWQNTVSWTQASYDWIEPTDERPPICRALTMLARWHLRTYSSIPVLASHPQTQWDGRDRLSLSWFSPWLEERSRCPLSRLLEDMFSQLVFAQHLRIALGRFDGVVQRLRFTLDDSGIVRTTAMKAQPPLEPAWMQDRLDAFVLLLDDLGVLNVDGDHGKISEGANSGQVPAK